MSELEKLVHVAIQNVKGALRILQDARGPEDDIRTLQQSLALLVTEAERLEKRRTV